MPKSSQGKNLNVYNKFLEGLRQVNFTDLGKNLPTNNEYEKQRNTLKIIILILMFIMIYFEVSS